MFNLMYVRLLLRKPNIGLYRPGYLLVNKTVTIKLAPIILLLIND